MEEYYKSFKYVQLRNLQSQFLNSFRLIDKPLRDSTAKIQFLSASPRFTLEATVIPLLVLIIGFNLLANGRGTSTVIDLTIYVFSIQKYSLSLDSL